MRATMLQGQNVVNFLRSSDTAVHLALLTQRMGCDVSVTNLAPPMAVTSVDLRVTLVATVALFLLPGVSRAEPLV